jgi:hypothetical protein
MDVETVMAGLKEANIVAAERLGRVRFSPHIYNTEEQMEKTARFMSRL